MHRLDDGAWRQARSRLLRQRHHDLEQLLSWDLFGGRQQILDRRLVEVALAKGRGISAIEELRGVPDFDVDARPVAFDAVARLSGHRITSVFRYGSSSARVICPG